MKSSLVFAFLAALSFSSCGRKGDEGQKSKTSYFKPGFYIVSSGDSTIVPYIGVKGEKRGDLKLYSFLGKLCGDKNPGVTLSTPDVVLFSSSSEAEKDSLVSSMHGSTCEQKENVDGTVTYSNYFNIKYSATEDGGIDTEMVLSPLHVEAQTFRAHYSSVSQEVFIKFILNDKRVDFQTLLQDYNNQHQYIPSYRNDFSDSCTELFQIPCDQLK